MIEGPVAVNEVLAGGIGLDQLYVDAALWADAGAGTPLRQAVGRAGEAGTPVWSLPAGVLAGVADTVNPQGLVAVAPRCVASVVEVAARPGPVLVLVDVADPGNAGTLVRAAEAAGAAGVVFVGTSTDPFGPKAVRAAAGSLLRLPVAEEPNASAAVETLRAAGRCIVACVAVDGDPPEEHDLTAPVAIVVGSEAHGLPEATVAAADALLTVPLAVSVESLNVAVAGAVVLFEAARQRRLAVPAEPNGSTEENPSAPASPRADPDAPEMDWTADAGPDRLGDR